MAEFEPVFFEMQLEIESAPAPSLVSCFIPTPISKLFCLNGSIGSVASVDVMVFLAAEPYLVAAFLCFAVMASNDYNMRDCKCRLIATIQFFL